MVRSLFDRIGGEAAIMVAVDGLYTKIMGDPLLAPYFHNLDLAAQSRKMVAFMAWAFGGPLEFRGRDLRSAHARLVAERGLGDSHFDRVAVLLEQTLRELSIADELIAEAVTLVARTREQVLGR